MCVVAFHFLLNLEVFVGKRLAHVLGLESQYLLEGILLAAEHLHLLLVVIQLLSQLPDKILHNAV